MRKVQRPARKPATFVIISENMCILTLGNDPPAGELGWTVLYLGLRAARLATQNVLFHSHVEAGHLLRK